MPHILCPRCGGVNRVPKDRPASAAKCGACHEKLFDGHPIAVDAVGARILTRMSCFAPSMLSTFISPIMPAFAAP